MKKMMIALVAMVMMVMSVNAQSNSNYDSTTFERMSSYLELRADQMNPMKTALEQFNTSMEAFYQLEDASRGGEAWEKIQTRHKATVKKILTEQQYDKYVKIFDLTVKNASERMEGQQTASL